jgi:hypothetical protein
MSKKKVEPKAHARRNGYDANDVAEAIREALHAVERGFDDYSVFAVVHTKNGLLRAVCGDGNMIVSSLVRTSILEGKEVAELLHSAVEIYDEIKELDETIQKENGEEK